MIHLYRHNETKIILIDSSLENLNFVYYLINLRKIQQNIEEIENIRKKTTIISHKIFIYAFKANFNI
jgi:hypothetical protein